MSKQINIREELNRRDMNSCTTDFVNMYESANLSADKKKSLVKLLSENVSNKRLNKFFEDIDYSNDDYLFKPYWYFTRHGVGPGSVPNYIHVLGVVDADNGSYFASDKVIQTKDLEEYELKERTPNADDVDEKVRINIQNWLEDPIEENLSNRELKEALSATKLEQEIRNTVRKMFASLDDEDYNDLIGDYLVVEIKEENGRTKVEVRAELSYTQMHKLANRLDEIIQKYDGDAYFDFEDSGIINAYISGNKLTESEHAPLSRRKPHNTFVKGDRVEVISNKHWTSSANENIGKVGTIENSSWQGNLQTFDIKLDNGENILAHKDEIKFEESLKENVGEQYLVEIQPDTEQETFNDYAGALDYFNARVSDYKKDSRNSDVSVALHKVVGGEIVDTLEYWKKDETLKEEYGYYKDEPYCEEIADRLEDGFWNGYTENDTEWDLEINGLSRSEFAPAFADWLAENISYPVRDGHLSYMDLDMFIAKDSIPGFHDSDDAEKLIPDLVKLGVDREDIDNWLKNPNADEELEFWIDYDVNFDVDEWEENNKEDIDLPTEVTYDFYSLVDDDVDIDSGDYNLDDVIANRLSDDYGYTHFGFEYDVNAESGDVDVYDIKWDISESLKESRVTTNSNKQPLKPATFTIDDIHPFEGYDEEYYWNGWECPWFTKEVGDTIVNYYKDTMYFDEKEDAFVFTAPYGRVDEEDPDYFVGQDIETVDGVKHLYPIGNGSWTWDKYHGDEDLEEDYTHFTYKSGANPYIAKTDKEAQRILNKYKGKVKETKKGFYEIDDTKEDSFITESVDNLLTNQEFVDAYKKQGFEGAEIILDWDNKQHTFEEWEELLLNTYLDLEQDLLAQGDFETVKHNRDTYINRIIGD